MTLSKRNKIHSHQQYHTFYHACLRKATMSKLLTDFMISIQLKHAEIVRHLYSNLLSSEMHTQSIVKVKLATLKATLLEHNIHQNLIWKCFQFFWRWCTPNDIYQRDFVAKFMNYDSLCEWNAQQLAQMHLDPKVFSPL